MRDDNDNADHPRGSSAAVGCYTAPPYTKQEHEKEREYRRGYWDGYLQAARDAEMLNNKKFTRLQEVANILNHFAHEELLPWRSKRCPRFNPPPELDIDHWEDIRQRVFERDGRECNWCGATDNLQIDHIHAVANGGVPAPENLQVLCQTCNLEKGAA